MAKENLAEFQEKIYAGYMSRTPKSRLFYDRACASLQSGVSASSRFFKPYPLYLTHGKGSKVYDVDGNEYVDCFLSAGPQMLGHCYPEVVEGVKRELDRGFLLYNVDLAVECAELLKEIIPCAEKVRFSNTGTEAVMLAARAARAYTGKNKIIKFYGQFHGIDDQFLMGISNNSDKVVSGGIPKERLVNTVLLKFNDIDVVRRKLEEDDDIAGIFVEAQMNGGGLWPASREYLLELRKLTKEHGVVLIFDEVITGFRIALGGAQEYFGVTPDLAVLAKCIAAGAKFAAVVGKEEFMEVFTPPSLKAGAVYHGQTYVDGTMAIAAAIAAIKIYKKLSAQGEYQRIFKLAERLGAGIETAFKQRSLPIHINIFGPSIQLALTNLEPDFDVYCNLDKTISTLFFLSLIAEGVYVLPSMPRIYVSFVHSESDVQKVIDAANASLKKNRFENILQS
jgi:glutamate-1-semialdehyde 2,1-aminomutase